MNETLEQLLRKWGDPLTTNTFSDAEDLIHMLLLELAAKEEVIKALESDIKYYKKAKT